ncbi:MAG: alanine racemase, partial [Nocardioidaceae bacterium]|nr:alanine racemase [Nocardioidaceae bacterium]
MSPRPRAEIVVDLDAVRSNVRRLRELVAPAALIVVVKADGYGHGMVQVGRAARAAGADWLAVATPDEAVALRDAGDEGPLMCWLAAPSDDYRPAVERGVTITAYDVDQLEAIAAAGQGQPVDVQLKLDTGLSRGGVEYVEWPGLLAAAIGLRDPDRIRLVGTWSHFACSDEPEHPANDEQERVFREAVDIARRAGLDPGMVHLSNSAAALLRPSARFDAVRVGLAAYGLNPAPGVLDTAA